MYNVLIVDDERSIRRGIASFIDWGAMNCTVAGEAENGLEAVKQIERQAPDIVITDIKMPGMNGIELSKYLAENTRSCKIIVLTGYADFSYAQTAIKYGVFDFLLKPTSKDQVAQAVGRAVLALEEQKQRALAQQNIEQRFQESLPTQQEHFLLQLLHGTLASIDSGSEMAQLKLMDSPFYLITLQSEPQPFDSAKHASLFSTLSQEIKSVLDAYLVHLLTPGNHLVCCVVRSFSSNEAECYQFYLNRCNELLEITLAFADINLSIGISAPHASLTELADAFVETKRALELSFYSSIKTSIFIGDEASLQNYDLFNDNVLEQVIQTLQTKGIEQAKTQIENLFQHYRSRQLPIAQLKNACIQICSACMRLLSAHSILPASVFPPEDNLYQTVLACRSIHGLTAQIQEVLQRTGAAIDHMEPSMSLMVKQAVDYLNVHYAENLTLAHLADYVHLNSSYFSYLFRKEAGETFTDMLTSLRMEEAKRLLKQPHLRTNEIAARIGIDDPAYFSQVFKRYTGFTPRSFRQHL